MKPRQQVVELGPCTSCSIYA